MKQLQCNMFLSVYTLYMPPSHASVHLLMQLHKELFTSLNTNIILINTHASLYLNDRSP